jgi:hypothetical protein
MDHLLKIYLKCNISSHRIMLPHDLAESSALCLLSLEPQWWRAAALHALIQALKYEEGAALGHILLFSFAKASHVVTMSPSSQGKQCCQVYGGRNAQQFRNYHNPCTSFCSKCFYYKNSFVGQQSRVTPRIAILILKLGNLRHRKVESFAHVTLG